LPTDLNTLKLRIVSGSSLFCVGRMHNRWVS
jgi:hypothetical protein